MVIAVESSEDAIWLQNEREKGYINKGMSAINAEYLVPWGVQQLFSLSLLGPIWNGIAGAERDIRDSCHYHVCNSKNVSKLDPFGLTEHYGVMKLCTGSVHSFRVSMKQCHVVIGVTGSVEGIYAFIQQGDLKL